MKSFKLAAASIGTATAMFAAGASAQSGGVLLPITITNASGNVTDMANAADGNPNTTWNSGGPAKQWIDIDLGSERMFSKLRMLTAQYPAGQTIHKVYGRTEAGSMHDFGTVGQYTTDHVWLEFYNLTTMPVRYLIIQTTKSPSNVAWKEFQVYDGGELATSCNMYTYNYGWALYASQPNGCGFQTTKYYYRDVRNLPTGAQVETCYLDNLNGKYGLKLIGPRTVHGQCGSFDGNTVWLFEKQ